MGTIFESYHKSEAIRKLEEEQNELEKELSQMSVWRNPSPWATLVAGAVLGVIGTLVVNWLTSQ